VAPLRLARRNIVAAGVLGRVSMLREHGLSGLAAGSVDAVVMAGLSGELMVSLLAAAPHVLAGVGQLLLQPNSDVSVVRT